MRNRAAGLPGPYEPARAAVSSQSCVWSVLNQAKSVGKAPVLILTSQTLLFSGWRRSAQTPSRLRGDVIRQNISVVFSAVQVGAGVQELGGCFCICALFFRPGQLQLIC